MREGVIKFRCDWTREPIAIPLSLLADLRRWRARLREAGLIGVLPDGIGFGNVSVALGPPGPGDPGGSGMEGGESPEGPLPHRGSRRRFLITGSGTGGVAELVASHYALVTDYDIERNFLACRGLTQASSESLSHAAIYAARPDVGAVFHVHSERLWKKWMAVLPTTAADFAYGTPEIALAVGRLAEESAPGRRKGMGRVTPEGGGTQSPPLPEGTGTVGAPTAAGGAPDPPPSAGAVVMGGHRDGLVVFGPDLESAGAETMRLMEGPPQSPAPPRTG